MAIVRQSSRRVLGTAQVCLRSRLFSTSVSRREDKLSQSSPPDSRSSPPYNSISDTPHQQSMSLLNSMSNFLEETPLVGKRSARTKNQDRAADSFIPVSTSELIDPNADNRKPLPLPFPEVLPYAERPGYFYIHGVSTTKNIHVTIADYKHNPIIVTSAGRHGLKHSKRQTVEAGYTTTVAAFEKLAKSNHEVKEVEIVLKGFGLGRRGFLSAIEGHHGEFLRRKVVRVTDATPLQIGYIKARNEKRS